LLYILIKNKFKNIKPLQYFYIMSLINILKNNNNLLLIKYDHQFVEEKKIGHVEIPNINQYWHIIHLIKENKCVLIGSLWEGYTLIHASNWIGDNE